MDYVKLCKASPKLDSKISDVESDKLKAAIDFLGWDVAPEEVRNFAVAAGLLIFGGGLMLIVMLSVLLSFSALWLLFIAPSPLLYFYFRRYPLLKADSERRKALSEMPELMSYLIMSLRINPNLEKAVEFAANHTKGLFKSRLLSIIASVRSGRSNAELGLSSLGAEFASRSDEFKRSMQLIVASTLERTEERRQATLDKASQVLLEGLAARTEKEARALNTPVMVIFTFGVILPLIFVAIIPFMSLMGINIGIMAIALMYTVGLPLFLLVLIKFIASGRPVTMAPPSVPAGKKKGNALIMAIVVGFALAIPAIAGKDLGAVRYLPLLWGIAGGAGLFLVATTLKTKKTRKKVKEIENGFGETLHQLGIILSEGKPLEDAMAASESGFFKYAARNIRSLNTDLRSALFSEKFGSLKEVHSGSVRGVLDTIVSISDKGSEAMAKVATRMSEHLRNLKKSEAEIERALGNVVSSMKIIAMVVAPLVGGMISSMSSVLADTMSEAGQGKVGFSNQPVEALDPAMITLIIGIYAMESAAILVMFGADLMHGNDKVMKKYSIGLALPISIFVFTLCVWVANGLFGGIA